MLLPKIAHKHHHSTNLSTVFSIKDGKLFKYYNNNVVKFLYIVLI
jgi:hypothetical protein